MIRRVMGYLVYRDDVTSKASRQLQDEGYTIIRGALSQREIAKLAESVSDVYNRYPPDGRGPFPTQWEYFRYEMLNRSAVCQQTAAHRSILDVIEPLLGEDCHVIANTAWRNPPTNGESYDAVGWHIDAGPHIPLGKGMEWPAEIPHPVFAIGVHIYLKDCRLEDGPTGVIPGSHVSGVIPPRDKILDDSMNWKGNDEVALVAQAGDVGFFVSDVWHRRMPTQAGDQGRFFLQIHYGRRDIAQRLRTTDDTHQLTPESLTRATTERDRTVAGLHPRLFYDG